MHRIIEGSQRNDEARSVYIATHPRIASDFGASAKPKGVRLGYMGHLTLISEDVIGALEHFPPDLRLQISQYAPQPGWDEYVTTRYRETKRKDTSLLGGGKPVLAPGMRGSAAQWKVDEEDARGQAPAQEGEGAGDADAEGDAEGEKDDEMEGMTGQFRRNVRTTREVSADFGAPMPIDDDEHDEFSIDEFRSTPPHVRISFPPRCE